jgi:hypothetical protein
MEAESESSESDHPIAATENNLIDNFLMDIDDDNSQLDPIKEQEVARSPSPPLLQVTIEDKVEDEEEYRWIENYPEPAGNTHGQDLSKFESLRKEQISEGSAPWFPFESEDEWELGRWLMTSGISQKKIDSFLKLHKVST